MHEKKWNQRSIFIRNKESKLWNISIGVYINNFLRKLECEKERKGNMFQPKIKIYIENL